MKVDYKKEDGKYVAAYPYHYDGFEFIYVENKKGKTLLFENRLASRGIWLNDKQISEMLQPILDAQYYWNDDKSIIISVGDKILIDSYKHRGIGIYDENGFLSKQSPDFMRFLMVVD